MKVLHGFRFFILNPQRGVLEYFVSQSEAVGNSYKPRGSVMLTGAVIAPSTEDSYTFSVNAANGEVYRLRGKHFCTLLLGFELFLYI